MHAKFAYSPRPCILRAVLALFTRLGPFHSSGTQWELYVAGEATVLRTHKEEKCEMFKNIDEKELFKRDTKTSF